MKSSAKLLLIFAAAGAFLLAQPVKADRKAEAGPSFATVPDGGSTISLVCFALLGLGALRSKLGR